MARSGAPRMFILLGLAMILVANAVLFGGRITAWVADGTGRILTPISSRSMHLRELVVEMAGRGKLAVQLVALQDEVLRLQSQLANREAVQQQMEFYRDAAGIRDRTGAEPIAAGIFSYPQSGGTRQAVINRGRADGVLQGDVVVTPSGGLVGAVVSVFEHHAIIRTIGDMASDVTVRVLGTEVSGLLRTSAEGGILMDLVQKNEMVEENAIVVTSGDDRYPAGLLVGTVRAVDNDSTTLFKIVHISPAVDEAVSGGVIVIRP